MNRPGLNAALIVLVGVIAVFTVVFYLLVCAGVIPADVNPKGTP